VELLREMALIGKPALGGNLTERKIGLSEQLRSVIHAQFSYVLSDRGPIVFPKFTNQMNPVNARNRR
jgi:hypothetical protein